MAKRPKPEPPLIYDVGDDRLRPITQADVEKMQAWIGIAGAFLWERGLIPEFREFRKAREDAKATRAAA